MADMWENVPSKYQLINIWMKHWKWQNSELFLGFVSFVCWLLLHSRFRIIFQNKKIALMQLCFGWRLIVMRLIFSISSWLYAGREKSMKSIVTFWVWANAIQLSHPLEARHSCIVYARSLWCDAFVWARCIQSPF